MLTTLPSQLTWPPSGQNEDITMCTNQPLLNEDIILDISIQKYNIGGYLLLSLITFTSVGSWVLAYLAELAIAEIPAEHLRMTLRRMVHTGFNSSLFHY
jgi:hypothetical protein